MFPPFQADIFSEYASGILIATSEIDTKYCGELKEGVAHKLYGGAGMDVCFLDGHVASEDGDVASVGWAVVSGSDGQRQGGSSDKPGH